MLTIESQWDHHLRITPMKSPWDHHEIRVKWLLDLCEVSCEIMWDHSDIEWQAMSSFSSWVVIMLSPAWLWSTGRDLVLYFGPLGTHMWSCGAEASVCTGFVRPTCPIRHRSTVIRWACFSWCWHFEVVTGQLSVDMASWIVLTVNLYSLAMICLAAQLSVMTCCQ